MDIAEVEWSASEPAVFPIGLMQMLPPEFAQLLGMAADPRVAAPVDVATHPCEDEMAACAAASPVRAAVETCLVAHYHELSPSCRCMVRSLLADSAPAEAVPAVPQMRAVEVEIEMLEEEDDEPKVEY